MCLSSCILDIGITLVSVLPCDVDLSKLIAHKGVSKASAALEKSTFVARLRQCWILWGVPVVGRPGVCHVLSSWPFPWKVATMFCEHAKFWGRGEDLQKKTPPSQIDKTNPKIRTTTKSTQSQIDDCSCNHLAPEHFHHAPPPAEGPALARGDRTNWIAEHCAYVRPTWQTLLGFCTSNLTFCSLWIWVALMRSNYCGGSFILFLP